MSEYNLREQRLEEAKEAFEKMSVQHVLPVSHAQPVIRKFHECGFKFLKGINLNFKRELLRQSHEEYVLRQNPEDGLHFGSDDGFLEWLSVDDKVDKKIIYLLSDHLTNLVGIVWLASDLQPVSKNRGAKKSIHVRDYQLYPEYRLELPMIEACLDFERRTDDTWQGGVEFAVRTGSELYDQCMQHGFESLTEDLVAGQEAILYRGRRKSRYYSKEQEPISIHKS